MAKEKATTPDEFYEKMEDITGFDGLRYFCDPEGSHSQADDLLCEVLREMGYGAGIVLFENMPKWYA